MTNEAETATTPEDLFYSKLGIPLAGLQAARNAIDLNRRSGNVVCIVGPAGIGKTHITIQAAADRKPEEPFEWHGKTWSESVPIKTLYLAHMQAEDMGVPYPSRAKRNEMLRECELYLRIAKESANGFGERARNHAQMLAEHVLDSGSGLDDGTFEFLLEKNLSDLPKEGILFLDEWNRADKSVIKAFFTLIEDREVHGVQLIPPGIQIVAAMNPSDGAYSVNEAEKDHAFRRRLSFVAVTVNTGGWLAYAKDKFHPMVYSFIQSMNSALYDARICAAGKVYPCPATWEKVSNVLVAADRSKMPLTDMAVFHSVCGHIGEATATIFNRFLMDNEILITPTDIMEKYKERSKVRTKIRKLVDEARNDVLNEVCTSVASTLMSTQPEPDKVAPCLARFLCDLQPEMAVAFISTKMCTAGDGIEGADAYMNEISNALHNETSYGEMFDGIASAMKKARTENDGGGTNPV